MGANSLDPGIKGSQLGNAARIQVPHGLKFRAGASPSARLRIAARGDTDSDTQDDSQSSFLGGLFGTGTQRVKAGQQDPSKGGTQKKKKLSAPSGGTKQLKRPEGNKGGGLLQRLGSQSTRRARKDPNTVFVAGSTGRVGLRIVRQLLLAGFKVRAGARNTDKARQYATLAEEFGILNSDAVKRLEIVRVDLEDTDTIVAAIGNAGRVVQAIGAAEDNVLDFGAPKRIDGSAAINLIEAAVETQADQYVMISSLGTGKFGWPASALNLFGGILFQKRRAEKALEDSGLQYVIVRPGGMERPTDDFKLTNNVRLSTRDTLFGGQVSRLQVAELVAASLSNPSLAENKVLEVVAEEEAPLLEYEQLLEQHPSEITQEEREQQKQFQEEGRSRVAKAESEVDDASAAFSEAQELVKQLKDALKEKQSAVSAAEKDLAPVVDEADQVAAELARLKEEAEENSKKQEAAKAVLNAAKAAKREGRAFTEADISSIESPILGRGVQTAEKPKKGRRAFLGKQQEGIADGISQKEIRMKLGQDGRGSSQQQKIAEGIAQKEIDMGLRKDGPEPSAEEKGLAEGIAKKEIAIDTGDDVPTQSWFGRKKAKPSTEPQISKDSQASQEDRSQAARKESAKPKPAKKEASQDDVDERRRVRNLGVSARAEKEASFLQRLQDQQKEELAKKAEAAEKRAQEARKKSAEQTRARLLKLPQEELEGAAPKRYKNAPKKRAPAKPAPAKAEAAKPQEAAVEEPTPTKPEDKKPEPVKAASAKAEPAVPSAEKAAPADAEKKAETNGSKPPSSNVETADGSLPVGDKKLPNAEEAKKWIEDWRAAQSDDASPAESNGSKPPSSNVETAAGSLPVGDDKLPNAKEAKQWIEDWRART